MFKNIETFVDVNYFSDHKDCTRVKNSNIACNANNNSAKFVTENTFKGFQIDSH